MIMALLNLDWSFAYLFAQSSYSTDSVVGRVFILIFDFAVYIFTSNCWYAIFKKLGEPNAWFAWVPILSNWKMLKAGDQD